MDFILDHTKPVKEFVDLRLYTYKGGQWYEVQQRQSPEEKIPRPPRDIFKEGDLTVTEHLIHGTPQPLPYITEFEYPTKEKPAKNGDTGGIYVHYLDFKYPRSGFPFPEAVQAANIAKRLLIGQIRWLAKNPLALVSLLRKKNLSNWIQVLGSAGNICLLQFYLQDFRYQKVCRELRKFIAKFLKEIGVDNGPAEEFSQVMISFFEFDDAYTTILKDLASETSKQALLDNPARELRRLLVLFKQRDARPKMHETAGSVVKLFRLAFLHPRLKRAFKKALEEINFDNVQMDESDRYNALRWLTYNTEGIPFEERIKKFMDIHEGIHPRMMVLQHDADK